MIDPHFDQSLDPQEIHRASAHYLAAPPDSCWRWADAGQTLEWISGATIAFTPELQSVLARLAIVGLPPLGAVIFLLAACRDTWPQSVAAIQSIAASHPLLPDVIASLNAVHALPAELRRTIDAKAVIAEIVFEKYPYRMAPIPSLAIARALADGAARDIFKDDEPNDVRINPADMQALHEGLRNIDPRRLETRIRCGLENVPGATAVDFSPSERVRTLLKSLTDDNELAGLARLAGNLMAAVSIPRVLADHEDLPQGGLSDLSNRGPLDRLLVSELAHDDQTLAVRLAMNEALFLRRESPPRSPPQRRAILLDSGIRLWGVPRVFAAATALAMVATAQKNCELLSFRARAAGITPIDLTTRSGLIAHLQALEPSPQPAGALEDFFTAIEQAANGAGEAMLITHEDVLADKNFQRECARHEKLHWFIAALSQSGSLSLWRQSSTGRRLISRAQLSLADIQNTAAPQSPSTPLIDGPDAHLPVILSARPFAFLLPQQIDPHLAAVSESHGLVGLAKDGRLLHWPQDGKGGWQLSDTVPRGRCHGVFLHQTLPRAVAILQPARGANVVMLTANLSNGRCETINLQTLQTHPIGVAAWGDLLLLIHRSHIEAVSWPGGQFIGRVASPHGAIHQGGRFFFSQGIHYAIQYDGQRLWIDRLTGGPPGAIRYFDRRGADGPLALLRDGRIVGPGQKLISDSLGPPIKRVLGISPGGHRIAVGSWHGSQPANYLIDLRDVESGAGKEWQRITGDAHEALLAPEIYRATRCGVSLRHNFQGIFHGGDKLALLSKKDHILRFQMSKRDEMILEDHGRPDTSSRKPVRFIPAAGPPGTRYELGVATWKDGSRAYLDSRGLLHLKSSDPTLPEISIVLSNGPLAGWDSDLARFGPSFYFYSAAINNAANFLSAMRAFTQRLR